MKTVWDILLGLIWPSGFFSKLGRLLAALSVLTLTKHAFDFGIGPTVDLLIQYYDRLVSVAVGWVEPFIRPGFAWLREHFGWDLQLYPHWRHIFVLMDIYFIREAIVTYHAGYRLGGVSLAVWGLTIALGSGVLAGAVPVVQSDIFAIILIVLIPLVGFFIFDSCDLAWDLLFFRTIETKGARAVRPLRRVYFGSKFRYIVIRPLIGIAVVCVGLLIPFIRQSASPGLLLLALLVLSLAGFWLWRGAALVGSTRRAGEAWLAAYLRTGATKLGIDMLGVFFWVAVFLVTSAGLGLYGL